MSPYMAQDMAENMQTPVSPVSAHNSPHDTTMGDQQQQVPRKRSHSVMSQQHDGALVNAMHSRAPSIHSQTGASPTEEFSPRGSRAFKRGDPPTNEAGKYICEFAEECYGQVFDRKCEWSKHMDKHDRPYRCPHPSCAKLQGFTYSGGLLRHEREVHGKHGGPKAQLMCPFMDCKRHAGKGFTRKENLNEHLRRVHQGKETPSQHDPLLEHNGAEVTSGADDGETQPIRVSTTVGEELLQLEPSLKRQRTTGPSDQTGHSQSDANASQETSRLRAENAWQADRIRQLEAALAMEADKTQRMEETMALWAQHNGHGHDQQEQQPQQELAGQQEQEQEQQFAQPYEDEKLEIQQLDEHQQLAQQQLVQQQLAEQQIAEHDTMEGNLKAALASVQEA